MEFEIDLDSECVWLDDAWLNREDLVRRIRSMMDAQNFEIARPGHALESLTRALANARLLALRISPEMSEGLNVASQAHGRPVGALAREAISAWLMTSGTPAAAPVPPAAAAGPDTTAPGIVRLPTPVSHEAAPPLSTTMVPGHAPTPEPAAGPGHKFKESDEAEKRWFDK